MTYQRMSNISREALPSLKARIPKGEPREGTEPDWFGAASERARKVLGLT